MNGIKTATITLWITLVCMLGFSSFIMKNQVQALEKELQRINAGIQNDIKSIHILKAEWSHLNSPARLKQLVEKHISINSPKAEQIVSYAALPFEYETERKILAQRNINTAAQRNKDLKVLVNVE